MSILSSLKIRLFILYLNNSLYLIFPYSTHRDINTYSIRIMLVIFLLACFGLLWLAHRFSLLLSLPIETSVRTLSIPIPKVPLISVDKVADTSMVIHWNDDSTSTHYSSSSSNLDHSSSKLDRKDGNNLKDSKDSNNITSNILNSNNNSDYDSNIISHYILYINGIESVLINGKQHKCTLDGLQPGTNYQIDLVAFNLAGFRSRSSPIFIKTSAKPIKDSNMQSLENPDNVIRCLLHEEERASVVKSDQFKATVSTGRSRSGTIEGHQNIHNNSNNSNTHHNDLSNSKTKHPHLIDDINELKWLLESGLEEVQSLMRSYKEAELEFEEEELNLISSRNEARERRKYEDNNRTNLRQEIKLLEEQRVKSASRISADEKKIKERLKKIENFNSQIEKWEKEIEHMKKKKEFILKENPENLKKLKQDIVTLNKQIFSSQTEVHEEEEDLRDEISKRKTLESQKIKVIQYFEEIDKNINDVTGLLSKEGLESLNKLIELKPEWKDELKKEIVEIDEKAESDWKALQQKEWLNFNNMKTEIDEQNKLSLINNNNNNNNGSNTNNNNNLTASINIENNPTTATNTTNVNGYLYNSLPSSSNNSINGFNNQNYSNNSMRNLIRPRITTTGSFHGSELLNEKSISQPDSTTNTFNSSNNANIWPINLSIDSNTTNMINPSNNDSINAPTVNMLLPQNLIDDEDFDRLFETQTRNQPTSSGSVNLMSPALSAVGINPSGSHQQNSSINNINNSVSSNNNNSVSPNIAQLNSFDSYPNSSINGLVLNSTPQNNRVTSLSALTSGNNQNNILTNSAPLNMIGSPQSLQAYLSNDNSLSANLLDLSHAATTSPFASNGPLNLNNTNSNNSNNVNNSGTNTTSDMEHSNILFNQNSVLLGSNLKDTNNHYSKIFGSLNGGNNNVRGNESSINNDNNGNSISRVRSTSFGSSIWSNGNNGNTSTWGSNNKVNNGFSFLGAPISMTSTTPNDSQNGIVYLNSSTTMNKPENNNDHNNFLFKNSTTISTSSDDKNVETAVVPENESPSHPSSPSFLKSMIEKFGASPSKTISNKTYEHAIDEYDDTVEEQIGKFSHNNGSNTHHKSTSLGSSRFFKLSRKNSVISSSQHSGATGSSSSNNGNASYLFNDEISNNNNVINHNHINDNDNSNVNSHSNNTNTSGFMGRKLSFAFKRDKDKEKY